VKTIYHIDANSAYLSWTAVDLLEKGHPVDLREVPSVVAGDPENRHGIILAKSIPAKRAGVTTAMSIMEARRCCPDLIILRPDYDLFLQCSEAMYEILCQYSDRIERYSVDECWLDYSNSVKLFGDPLVTAYEIKSRIHSELGFTVNVGVSCNKLLAKMGSEMQKPDRVHTLYPEEIPEKMWPLPVGELFFCGRRTAEKLTRLGINTIGELAHTELSLLKSILKPVHGTLMHEYANGIDRSPVDANGRLVQKGVGNATTIAYDVYCESEAYEVLLALAERVGYRLRKFKACAQVASVTIRNADLNWYRHQRKLPCAIATTTEIYETAKQLFSESWRGEPVRQLGIHLGSLCLESRRQLSMLERPDAERLKTLDRTVDEIRHDFGKRSVMRGTFANTELDPLLGGVNDGDYLMMGGYSL